jgi:hypothetical protein
MDQLNGLLRGMASFVRLLLQRIVQQGPKKAADIQKGTVFCLGARF